MLLKLPLLLLQMKLRHFEPQRKLPRLWPLQTRLEISEALMLLMLMMMMMKSRKILRMRLRKMRQRLLLQMRLQQLLQMRLFQLH